MKDLRKYIAMRLVQRAVARWAQDAKSGKCGYYAPGEVKRYKEYFLDDPGGWLGVLSDYGICSHITSNYYLRGV